MSRSAVPADVFQAIADPTRRRILSRLCESTEVTASELAAPFGMTQSAVSQHLKVLRDARLVVVTPHGRERRYRLNAHPLYEVAVWINAYSRFWDERLAGLGDLLENEP
ncbi:MAG: metalloregulator ArsR/SmtB family transcription factor [Capsulimonadales bacterium]|nr:metalloregulator ArsR/SmtB family transcription factor [Capsulimonadales bacterium]